MYSPTLYPTRPICPVGLGDTEMPRRYSPEEWLQAYWAKSTKGDGCWQWQGPVNTGGYGTWARGRRTCLAHRLSYELTYGAIPEGAFVLHECDNALCVRPDHLSIGDAARNMADAAKRLRMPRGEAHFRSRLTEEAVRFIKRALAEQSATQAELARQFGVRFTTIAAIKQGRSWSWVY